MILTEQDLNVLNEIVYDVDASKKPHTLTETPTIGLVIKLPSGALVEIVALSDDSHTGFQGLAVAPIINGVTDYNQITIVAAGTDPSVISTDLVSAPFNGRQPNKGGGQIAVAKSFVQQVNSVDGQTVTQLTGYSQSAYMLEVGGSLEIPTTVFNGWFVYFTLSGPAKAYIESNPNLFMNYRHTDDKVTWVNDFNSKLTGDDFGTIIWIEGSSHSLSGWMFDENGNLISGDDVDEMRKLREKQIMNQTTIALYSLTQLRNKLSSSGGGLSESEKIYLDRTGALLTVDTASKIINDGLSFVILMFQDSIDESIEIWTQGLQHARSIGTLLTEGEIIDALARAGATKVSIITEQISHYEDKINKANRIRDNFENLIKEIKVGIELLVQSDQDLANQLGQE